ncbi:hypothetical protein [Paracoccus sp. N5]|uniref:hypothetical protein n=1 Tax=Paracoccus sp. N5 TaxID=1101189 RepID=UPI00036515AE|nr:hypothetical protein [Paracoccus sp. N5]
MNPDNPTSPAAFMTLPVFCKVHGFKEHAVRRAVNTGLLPVYQPFGARQYLRVDEALAFIATCRKGGVQ